MAMNGDDDGLDRLRRDLADLVLREAGGRVAADPASPLAQLLTSIVRREMGAAVEALRQDPDTDIGGLRGGYGGHAEPAAPNRRRDAMIAGLAAVLAVLIFGGGFVAGGGLEKLKPAPVPVVTAPAVVDPAGVDAASVDPAAVAPAGGAGTVDGTTGMATQLQGRPQ